MTIQKVLRVLVALASVALTLALSTTTTKTISNTRPAKAANNQNPFQESQDDSAISSDDDDDNDMRMSRRRMLRSSVISAAAAIAVPNCVLPASSAEMTAMVVPSPPFTKDVSWPLGKVAFSLLPLAGTSSRRGTVEECVVPDTIWTHDQIQGVVNVNVPVRQTVVKLKQNGGGLWVHNPVAPTPQLIRMVQDLEQLHGPVRHIVLGSVALEHKATFGAFCRKFPKATVWVQPGQWAFPVNLPIDTLGVTQRGALFRELPVPGREVSERLLRPTSKYGQPEWQSEIDYEVLGPLEFKSVGAFSETAFYHKSTKSLIVTDTVVSVDKNPPKIIEEDARAMLFHARDSFDEVLEDTPENRSKGWRRMVQFGLIFFPSQIDVVPAGEALKEARKIDPRMSNLGDGAVPFKLYPWTWHGDSDKRNFETISRGGALFCPPILTKLILDREPKATLAWVDTVCRRFPDMQRIVPCHLNNNVKATAKDFYEAFEPLRSTPDSPKPQRALGEDLAVLQRASDLLTKFNVVGPSLVCDGEPARTTGRFATAKK